MKYVNPGIAELCSDQSLFQTVENVSNAQSLTGLGILRQSGGIIEWRIDCGEASGELWASLDYYVRSGMSGWAYFNFFFYGEDGKRIVTFGGISSSGSDPSNVFRATLWDKDSKSLYTHGTNIPHNSVRKNLELHIRTGEDGVFDVWVDRKLLFSFPAAVFSGKVQGFGMEIGGKGYDSPEVLVSSIILQDTGRIGMEKLCMLTASPAGEQTLEAGSAASFVLGGLDGIPEDTEITGMGVVLQATSRDDSITRGTFALEGSVLGTVDATDASGTAYEQVFAPAHPATGKPFTKEEIEGKTLTLAVDGDA